MKFGEMKYDIDVIKGIGKNMLGIKSKKICQNEGKRLFKHHSEYKYLENDPWVNDDAHFYESVLYAYMAECILKEHTEFKDNYNRCKNNAADMTIEYKSSNDGSYLYTNLWFVQWYQDYLREQANPGILERETKEYFQKQRELQEKHKVQEMRERVQLQQDLASGKCVVCPYCHSTNTEKIGTVSRAVSISLVGAASSKLGKQWHCNNCKSDF